MFFSSSLQLKTAEKAVISSVFCSLVYSRLRKIGGGTFLFRFFLRFLWLSAALLRDEWRSGTPVVARASTVVGHSMCAGRPDTGSAFSFARLCSLMLF